MLTPSTILLEQVADDLLSRHSLRLVDHGDSPLVTSLVGTDESERRGGRTTLRLRLTRSYTTLRDVTPETNPIQPPRVAGSGFR